MRRLALVLTALALTACGRGYISDNDLSRGEIGPDACVSRCEEMGLRMGAFVMVNHGYAGCVCSPPESSGGQASAHAAQVGAVVATADIIERERERQRQQQQQ